MVMNSSAARARRIWLLLLVVTMVLAVLAISLHSRSVPLISEIQRARTFEEQMNAFHQAHQFSGYGVRLFNAEGRSVPT